MAPPGKVRGALPRSSDAGLQELVVRRRKDLQVEALAPVQSHDRLEQGTLPHRDLIVVRSEHQQERCFEFQVHSRRHDGEQLLQQPYQLQ